MADYPPLSRFYVASYASNDRDYPVVAIRLDPRTAGYKVPEDLSPHPDSKRYPNHVFTGAQPASGDQIVTHVYEILPSPWVPFTRYDDDLGPIQGRRRSVKNEGQVASLAADKRVNYEAREGSAIVYTELEESWSVATDDDGNSLFPIRDRDFYDASRGAVQERRQLFVPTGEEEGTLENINGVITQTSYEPYNEFLSVKIVQTYKVNGPQLIGNTTNGEGQLATVTTQRKGALGYIPPNPTATKTVEVSREDAESLIERVVDLPEVFRAETFSIERPDPIPQKFRVALPVKLIQETISGDAGMPALSGNDLARSEEQQTKFVKRISQSTRDQVGIPKTLTQKATDNDRQLATVTEVLQVGDTTQTPTAKKTVESESLGDGKYVVRTTEVPEVFSAITFTKERPDPVPQKFRVNVPALTKQENLEGEAEEPEIEESEINKSEQQVNKFVKRVSTTSRDRFSLPRHLSQKTTTNEGLLASVTETLQSGDTSATPTAKRTVQSESLGDGTYVVTITDLPKVFSGETYTVEQPEVIPAKFRGRIRTLTTQQTVEGTADPAITLSSGELSKSEQQITEFLKRTSLTSQDLSDLPISLVQRATDNDKQLVSIAETLQLGDSVEQPSATVSVQSESLGDGRYLVTRSQVPEVFSSETYRKAKDDLTPQKFRAKTESLVFEQNIEGTAEAPTLEEGEFEKSEQQVNKFVKRVSTTSRNVEETTNLKEYVVTQRGQVAERTLTLANESQTIEADALLIDGSVEELGDGRTVKTEVKVENLFDNKTVSLSKPEVLPERFRASIETKTEQEIIEQNSIEEFSLTDGEIERTEERVTEFTVRKSITTRNEEDAPELNGLDYEESFDVQIPYTEKITTTLPTSGSSEAVPLDNTKYLVREYNQNEIENYLNDFLQSHPTTINLNLPRVLESIDITWDEKEQKGNYENTPFAAGVLYQFSNSDKGEASGLKAAIPIVNINFKDIWSQNIPATVSVFFLKNPVTKQEILSKVGASEWPTFKPKSHVITGKGVEIRATASVAASISVQQSKPSEFGGYTDQSKQRDFSRSITPINISIPPCLHEAININESKSITLSVSASARTAAYGIFGSLVSSESAQMTDTAFVQAELGSTSPTNIPNSGVYLIDSSVEFFKYGFSIVRATTIDASIFA
jgi:hypothetical protein